MPHYHEAAELAPRDIVSRAIVMEMQKARSDFVYLDLTGLDPEHVQKRFPRIYTTCLKYNIDITADLVPIRPAAHYAMGGVATDLHGATSLQGLYAAGEVAATGVHGANRLASNSLLEGLVFGARAASGMTQKGSRFTPPSQSKTSHRAMALPNHSAGEPKPALPEVQPDTERGIQEIRCILWEKVGIIRHGKDLGDAVRRLKAIQLVPPRVPARRFYEAQNILEVGSLIARCALAREESRGAHYRADSPLKDDSSPPKHSYVGKDSSVFFA
jgi:L-aspartate oxidase